MIELKSLSSLKPAQVYWLGPEGEQACGSDHYTIATEVLVARGVAVAGMTFSEKYDAMFDLGYARVREGSELIFFTTHEPNGLTTVQRRALLLRGYDTDKLIVDDRGQTVVETRKRTVLAHGHFKL